MRAIALLIPLMLIAGDRVFAFPGDCLLKVQQRIYLSGRCNITVANGGSFTVGVGDRRRSRYFAYVTVNQPGRAEGSWNGPDAESHAGYSLGDLTKSRGCWVNRDTKICAIKRK